MSDDPQAPEGPAPWDFLHTSNSGPTYHGDLIAAQAVDDAAAEIVEVWQPTRIQALLGELEAKVAWMAETIDELVLVANTLAEDFAAYRAKYPPPPE